MIAATVAISFRLAQVASRKHRRTPRRFIGAVGRVNKQSVLYAGNGLKRKSAALIGPYDRSHKDRPAFQRWRQLWFSIEVAYSFLRGCLCVNAALFQRWMRRAGAG